MWDLPDVHHIIYHYILKHLWKVMKYRSNVMEGGDAVFTVQVGEDQNVYTEESVQYRT